MNRRDLLRAFAVLPVLAPLGRVRAQPAAADNLHLTVAGRLPDSAQVRRVVAAGPPASVLVYCLAPQALAG